jgi:hypothetical protein
MAGDLHYFRSAVVAAVGATALEKVSCPCSQRRTAEQENRSQ